MQIGPAKSRLTRPHLSHQANSECLNGNSCGGGLKVNTGAVVTLSHSAILSSTADMGGGIYSEGTLIIQDSTVAGNSTVTEGGGIDNGGTLQIENSTLSGNSAQQYGGAIFNRGVLTLTNSTISGNTANGECSIYGGGGAINQWGSGASAVIHNSTIVNNTAADSNGARSGIWLEDGILILHNSIVANNNGTNNFMQSGGTFTSRGYNLSNAWNGISTTAIDLTDDPRLGSLADNGGGTRTHMLLPGSPAIDAGDALNCPATDQRGVPRPQGARCDIGSYEDVDYFALTVHLDGAGSVTSDPAGIDCGTDCTAWLANGTVVTLTASTDPNFVFSGWHGACSGTEDCLVAMTATQSVTATFALAQYALTTVTDGNGSGAVSVEPDQDSYNYGTVVTLTASADTGSAFMNWSGDFSGNTNPMTVTITAHTLVTGTFTLAQYALTTVTDGNGSGSVSVNPAQSFYDYGTVVTLTANADVGSAFVDWSGDLSGSTNPITVTITANTLVTGTFALAQYELNVSFDGNGSGIVSSDPAGIDCGSDCAEIFDYGTIITLTATADTDSTFTGRSGACTGAGACLVTMDEAQSVAATFVLAQRDYLICMPLITKP